MSTQRPKKNKNIPSSPNPTDDNLQILIEIEPPKEDNKKLVVSAEKFNNFETMSQNRKLSTSSESSSTNSTHSITNKINNTIIFDTNNIIELETDNNNDVINGEAHNMADPLKLKDIDNDKMEGEKQQTVEASCDAPTSSSAVSNKNASCVAVNNKPIIITNLAGKKISIIPKTAPVVLNNNNTNIKSEDIKPIINNNIKSEPINLKPLKILKTYSPKQNKNLIKPIPNATVMKISDVNKSQHYFNNTTNDNTKYCNLKIKKTESLAEPSKKIYFTTTKTLKQIQQPIFNQIKTVSQLTNKFLAAKSQQNKNKLTDLPKCQKIERIDLTKERSMDNLAGKGKQMPDFSKILQVLTESEQEERNIIKDITKIPIYVDSQTQTENLRVVKDQSVQTEACSPSPIPSEDDLPNITNLLEYVLNTPKYSTGLDEGKKSDLIGMSKTIVLKGKMMTQHPKNQEQLKRQLFLDLKDCATFDFLGNKPIHNAVLDNNLALLKRQIFALRLRRISLDIENNQGQTALQLAIIHNCNLELIYELLTYGASANIQDNEGNTLVHLAVVNSTHTVLELLINHLKEPVKEINRKNDEGLTPLMIAAIDSKAEFVDLLLRSGADPNLRDEKSGRTALFHAVELNCNFVINLLLKYKADPKVRNYFGLTALDAAKDLDIADAKMLEDQKEERNQTSVIVNMTKNPEKRGLESNNSDAKRTKLNIVKTYQRSDIKNRKTASNNGRKKKTT